MLFLTSLFVYQPLERVQSAPVVQEIDWDAWIVEDVRLTKPVSGASSTALIGHVLERCRAQTKVDVAPDDATGAGDESLRVRLEKVPLHRVLRALLELQSFGNARWTLHREKSGETYVYRLVRPKSAEGLSAALISRACKAVETSLFAALDALPENPKDDSLEQQRLRMLRDTVPTEALRGVLRGEIKVYTRPLSELSPEVAARFRAWDRTPEGLGGTADKTPATRVRVALNWDGELPIPTVLLGCMRGENIGSAVGVAPIREPMRALEPWLRESWGHRSEQSEPRETPSVRVPTGAKAPAQITEFLGRSGISYLAQIPVEARSRPLYELPPLVSLERFLATLTGTGNRFMAKWSGDMLLVSHPRWLMDDGPRFRARWPLVKEWESVETSTSLETALRFARLSREAPSRGLTTRVTALRSLAPYLPLFRYMAADATRLDRAKSSEGLPMDGTARAAFNACLTTTAPPDAALLAGGSLRLHLSEERGILRGDPLKRSVTTIHVRVKHPDGSLQRWVMIPLLPDLPLWVDIP